MMLSINKLTSNKKLADTEEEEKSFWNSKIASKTERMLDKLKV